MQVVELIINPTENPMTPLIIHQDLVDNTDQDRIIFGDINTLQSSKALCSKDGSYHCHTTAKPLDVFAASPDIPQTETDGLDDTTQAQHNTSLHNISLLARTRIKSTINLKTIPCVITDYKKQNTLDFGFKTCPSIQDTKTMTLDTTHALFAHIFTTVTIVMRLNSSYPMPNNEEQVNQHYHLEIKISERHDGELYIITTNASRCDNPIAAALKYISWYSKILCNHMSTLTQNDFTETVYIRVEDQISQNPYLKQRAIHKVISTCLSKPHSDYYRTTPNDMLTNNRPIVSLSIAVIMEAFQTMHLSVMAATQTLNSTKKTSWTDLNAISIIARVILQGITRNQNDSTHSTNSTHSTHSKNRISNEDIRQIFSIGNSKAVRGLILAQVTTLTRASSAGILYSTPTTLLDLVMYPSLYKHVLPPDIDIPDILGADIRAMYNNMIKLHYNNLGYGAVNIESPVKMIDEIYTIHTQDKDITISSTNLDYLSIALNKIINPADRHREPLSTIFL